MIRLTSKSIKLLIANKSVSPKKRNVIKFLESPIEVTNDTEPICQSCERVAGQSNNHQLKAAK